MIKVRFKGDDENIDIFEGLLDYNAEQDCYYLEFDGNNLIQIYGKKDIIRLSQDYYIEVRGFDYLDGCYYGDIRTYR